ncbi:MAG: rhodanese-related sulfurtransferase, partial [Chlamydiia bacterium]|nr:rhodanese-related sulfurtransferase [Chlamydiia bacterium]
MSRPYQVFAFYKFTPVENAQDEVAAHKEILSSLDARGRIYISEEGYNGQMSIHEDQAETYLAFLRSRPGLQEMPVKIHTWETHVFEKMTVKYRAQIVALDAKVDMSKTGAHLSPEEWSAMLAKKEERILIDVRNDYEWKVGHFEGSELPNCSTFREFKEYTEELKDRIDPEKTPVMMCCTGGIRCEIYSAYMKERGFQNVYQLDGGIINYGLKEGSKHWLGKLFVFDDRMTVPISDEEAPVISSCAHCGTACDDYYNCAN